MRKILLSTVALAAFAGQAFAADLPSRKAAAYLEPVSAFSWTGFYAGVEGGADWVNTTGTGYKSNGTYGLLGGLVGYNYQINNFVVGVEANLDGVIGGSRSLTGLPATATDATYNGDIRGRLGFAANRALFYFAGGLAFGDVKTLYPGYLSTTSNRTGYTLGGGVEYAFTNNWIGRVEYRYTDLGHTTSYAPFTDVVRNNSNALLLGVSYKFGAPAPVVAKY